MEFFQNIDWMMMLKAFVVGGAICIIGQLLIDKTKLTPARILVIFVTAGCILGGLGLYQHLVDFAGAGATVPLTGFGNSLAKGAIEEVQKTRIFRSIYRRNKSNSRRNCSSYILWISGSTYIKTKN